MTSHVGRRDMLRTEAQARIRGLPGPILMVSFRTNLETLGPNLSFDAMAPAYTGRVLRSGIGEEARAMANGTLRKSSYDSLITKWREWTIWRYIECWNLILVAISRNIRRNEKMIKTKTNFWLSSEYQRMDCKMELPIRSRIAIILHMNYCSPITQQLDEFWMQKCLPMQRRQRNNT